MGNNPLRYTDPLGLTQQGGEIGATIGTVVATVGSVVVDASTGGLNIVATPAEIAFAATTGYVVGDVTSDFVNYSADVVSQFVNNVYEMAKGERNWGKKRGNDPLWDEDIEKLKDIEKNDSDARRRENAKKIRKMKEKSRGKPCN